MDQPGAINELERISLPPPVAVKLLMHQRQLVTHGAMFGRVAFEVSITNAVKYPLFKIKVRVHQIREFFHGRAQHVDALPTGPILVNLDTQFKYLLVLGIYDRMVNQQVVTELDQVVEGEMLKWHPAKKCSVVHGNFLQKA